MTARIYQFPARGKREDLQRNAPLAGLAGVNFARFGALLPLCDEDGEYIVRHSLSSDPAARHRASELLACAMALRHYKSHPQGQIAKRILLRARCYFGIQSGPRAA